jgi:thiol-disulfide isomerase/thioredoxin
MVAALATAAAAQGDVKTWTGKATPRLSGTDLQGRKLDLKDYRGRVVVLNFWATWCGPCKDELPSLQRLRDKLDAKRFEVLTVNYGESAARVGPYVEQERLSLPVLLDTQKDIAKEWKVGGLPMTYVIDAKGRARYSVFGERDWSVGDSLRLVEKLIGEARARR